MLEMIVSKPVYQRRYFIIKKYCRDYAIFECIEEGDKKFERKVADDIESKSEAGIMAAALTVAEGRE